MVGLISSPLMQWSTRLPELGSLLKDKLHIFDRPLALWRELQSMVGGPDTLADTLATPFGDIPLATDFHAFLSPLDLFFGY